MANRKGGRRLLLAGVWALCSVGVFCGAAFLSLALVGTLDLLGIRFAPRSPAHGVELAAWLLLWAVLAGIGITLVTAVLSPPVHFSLIGLGSALTGVVLAASFDLSLQRWAAGRGLDYSYDYVGPSIVLPALVMTVALSGFALAQAPFVIRPLIRATAGTLALLTLAIAATNFVGMRDGLGADSVLLALLLFLSSAYVLAAAISQLRAVASDLSGLFRPRE